MNKPKRSEKGKTNQLTKRIAKRSKNAPLTIFQWFAAILGSIFGIAPRIEEKTLVKDTTEEITVPQNIISRRALMIGSKYSETEVPLYGCINDLNNINKFLKTREFTNIIMVSDDEPIKKPTKQIITDELTDFLKKSNETKNEILYIHFSGHGIQRYTTNLDELDAMNELICTYEDDKTMSHISDNVLNKLIVDNLAADATLYIVFDCCHSGTMLDLKYTYHDTLQGWLQSDIIKDTDKKCGHVIMLSGCCDPQTSSDAQFTDEKMKTSYQGALTFAMLHAINMVKETEIGKIYHKTLAYLYQNDFEQYPQLSTNRPFSVDGHFLS